MVIDLPANALVVLIGATGSGKSTFARRHFRPTEVLSSDFFRGLVSDDEDDQSATSDAFEVLHLVAARRLAAGRLTVIDATNAQPKARRPLVELAARYHRPIVAIVLDVPARVSAQRNGRRPNRAGLEYVLARQRAALIRSIGELEFEGFDRVWILRLEDVDSVQVVRSPA